MNDPFSKSFAPPPLAVSGRGSVTRTPRSGRVNPLEVARVACRALALPQDVERDSHHVGAFQIGDNQAAVEAISHLSRAESATRTFSLPEYLNACRHVGTLQTRQLREERELLKAGFNLQALLTPREREFLATYSVDAYTPDIKGYAAYQGTFTPDFTTLLERFVPVRIPEAARREHTYLIGATGYGKSELLKAFIHSYVTKQNAAVVVIDPAGEFVEQIARWPEFVGNDRLVYFHPTLAPGRTPTLNPLQSSGVGPSDISERAVRIKQVLAQQLLAAFEQVIAGGLGSAVSLPMRALLTPCILTLLDRPGSTLLDLQRFMDDTCNIDLIEFGATRTHYKTAALFQAALRGPAGFRDKRYNITKGSIFTKLQELFNTGFFVDLTCGESTIDLARAIDQRRVVLFNLGKGLIGDDESQALGRLIVALLQGIAKRRIEYPNRKHVPIHFFIDECHNFITPSVREIMLEQRKFKLYLTLAQQIVGEGMTPAMRTVITGSANLHISGYAQPLHQADAARLVGCVAEEIGQLNKGDFYVRMGRHPAFRFQGRSDLLEYAHSMTDPSWKRLVARQLRRYYRLKTQVAEPAAPEPAAGGGTDDVDDSAARWEP